MRHDGLQLGRRGGQGRMARVRVLAELPGCRSQSRRRRRRPRHLALAPRLLLSLLQGGQGNAGQALAHGELAKSMRALSEGMGCAHFKKLRRLLIAQRRGGGRQVAFGGPAQRRRLRLNLQATQIQFN